MIRMESLRTLCESLKLRNPTTYVQSGNVVFSTTAKSLPQLAARLETAIEGNHGFRPSVILRTASELREVIAASPFAARTGLDPAKLVVVFLATPAPEIQVQPNPEEIHIRGRELYIYFPNGMGQSKLSLSVLERQLKTPMTARNWNSVTRLLAIAETLEASH